MSIVLKIDLSQGNYMGTYFIKVGEVHIMERLIPDYLTLTEEDIHDALKEFRSYIDIAPSDFRELYYLAYKHMIFRLVDSVRAGDIMTEDVVYVYNNTKLKDVILLMGKHHISGVPVIDSHMHVVGVISEKDLIYHLTGEKMGSIMTILTYLIEGKLVHIHLSDIEAAHIMSAPPLTVFESTPVLKVIELISKRQINRVPVVNSENILKGIITRNNLFNPSCSIIVSSKEITKKG